MISKRKMLLTSGILGLFVMVAGIQAGSAAPVSLPTNISEGQVINGYKLVWYNTTTANCSFDSTSVNVTCWTTIWWNNVTSRIIGASLVDKGGNILNKAINLTGTDTKTLIARGILTILGLNSTTIDGIKNVWDLMIALLIHYEGSSYTLTQPDVPKADHAVLLTITGRPYFKHALFATKGAYMLLALDYDIANYTVPNWANATLIQNVMMAKFQLDVWFFWGLFGHVLYWIGQAANWLASSSVPASSAPATSGKIAASAIASTSDMENFAAGWAGLFSSSIPGYESSIIIGMTTLAVVMIGIKAKKSRKE